MSFISKKLVLIITLLIIINASNCPEQCLCNPPSISCNICLYQKFFRYLQSTTNTCPCNNTYIQNFPPSKFCCSQNCSTCSQWGCISCRTNWTLQWNQNILKYDCVCKKNYYYEPTVNDCICRSNNKAQSSFYYQPNRFQCNVCPQKCKCDESGCKNCDPTLSREIKLSSHNISTCYCGLIFVEIDKKCVASITPISCPKNQVNINGTCQCVNPYIMDGSNCICSSYKDATGYYQYLGICYRCPSGCMCNEFGCVSCQISANRTISYNNCSCIAETFEVFSECLSLSPYNQDLVCNSQNYPTYFYQIGGICRRCPKGCNCTGQSCGKCIGSSNRDNNNNCACKSPFIQIDNQCIGCPNNFLYVNNSCICPNIQYKQLVNAFYYDQQYNYCGACPSECTCNDTGCYSCPQSTFRKIATNIYNNKTCYCDGNKKFQENKQNKCQCIPPYVLNTVTNVCQCITPFKLNSSSECVCLSNFQDTVSKYYLYDKYDCRPCPEGCICNASGCVSCSSDSGRVILVSNQNLKVCVCFPITMDKSTTVCKNCPQGQYVWKNVCMNCSSKCLTCNSNSCKTCRFPTYLYQGNCICTNNDLANNIYNQNGVCVCNLGYYNDTLLSCLACPLNCRNCKYNNNTENHVVCIQCNQNVFRQNKPQFDCPCIDKYNEGLNVYSYCCHFSCQDCNQKGCTSCLSFGNRFLDKNDTNNVTCKCNPGFLQQYNLECRCPPQTYLYTGQCIKCPQYCLQCSLILQTLNCSKCAPNYNRILAKVPINNSIYFDCSCKSGYQQISGNPRCFSQFCINYTASGCSQCTKNRILKNDTCVCASGFYQNNLKQCQSCSKGCLDCSLKSLCKICNSSDGYYLIFNIQDSQSNCQKPKTDGYIFAQNTKNMIFSTIIQNGSSPITDVSLYLVLSNRTDRSNTFPLQWINYTVTGNVFTVILKPFIQDYLGVSLIQLSYKQDQSIFTNYSLIKNKMYLPTTLTFEFSYDASIKTFVILIIIISLIFTLLGNKENQLINYCQILSFLAMNVQDINMQIIPFLVYFRISTFTFLGIDSNSPFASLVSNWNVYTEKSKGNYNYFVNDSNLIRNCGLTLYFAMQNTFFIILLRFIYFKIYNTQSEDYPKLKNLIQKYKRTIYRIIDWFYKVTMFPLIFYSLNTLINLDNNISLIYQNFQFFNQITAAIIISLYSVVTIIQFIYNETTQFSRYFMLIEFVSDVLMSIVIIKTVYDISIMALIPVMLTRGLLQLLNQYIWIRNFTPRFYRKLGFTLIECCSVISIYYSNRAATVFLIVLYFIGFIGFQIYVYWKIYKENAFEKRVIIEKRRKFNSIKEQIQVQKGITQTDTQNIIL